MAQQAPTVQELLALIQKLRNQVDTLNKAATTGTTATTATVVFVDTPNTLEVENSIDYNTKQGASIYEQGCQALDDKAFTEGFSMSINQSVVFVEALHHKASQMGWNQGSKQITSFVNRDGNTIDIIKEYGQIDKVTLKTQCERFCKAGEADAQSRAKQNNTMMCICLGKTLTAPAQAKLLACYAEFTFYGVEYALLMYKIIMRLTTMDSVATNQTLRKNLQAWLAMSGFVPVGYTPQTTDICVCSRHVANVGPTRRRHSLNPFLPWTAFGPHFVISHSYLPQ